MPAIHRCEAAVSLLPDAGGDRVGSVGTSRPATVVIGRVAERAALAAASAEARAGRATLVLVEGPAGFGKTVLVADLLAAQETGVVLRATAEVDEAGIEYGVLGQLLRGWPGPPPAALAAIVAGRRTDVDALAAGLELLALMDEAPTGALTLVVDDVHWADVASVRALVFAVRRAAATPLLTVLTCRTEELAGLPPSLRRLLAADAVRIRLGRFGPDEVQGLARLLGHPALAPRDARRIAAHTGGSPLFARALLSEIGPAGHPLPPEGPLPVPDGYSRLIEDRLDAVTPGAAALARAASVMTVPRPLALVSTVADIDEPDAFAALDAAVAAGLLQPPGPDRVLRLVHPLARVAVYQSMPTQLRAALHRRAGDGLTATDPAAALRHRAAAVAGVDEALAGRVAAAGTAALAGNAWSSAAAWYRTAIRLSPPDGAAAGLFLLQLVEALVLGGDTGAEPAMRAELDRRPPGARRDYLRARLSTLAGDPAAARVHAQSAWEAAEGDPDCDAELRARIAAELARTSLTSGYADSAAGWAACAVRLAPAGSSAAVDSPGVALLAGALRGGYAPALQALAALPLTIAEPAPHELDGLIARGILRTWTGDLRRAEADLRTVVRVTRRDGPVHLNLGAAAYLSDLSFRIGEWDAAVTEAETGIAVALDLDHLPSLPLLYAAAATPHAARGEFDPAARYAAEAVAIAERVGDMQTQLWAAAAAARLAAARGDHQATLDALEPLLALGARDGLREPGLQPWQCLHAAALAYLGRTGDAEQVLLEAARIADERAHPTAWIEVARTRAEIFAAQDRLDDAAAILAGTAEAGDALATLPFEQARLDLIRGHVARRTGARRQAADSLQRARTIFAGLRARPWLERADQELDRCGLARRLGDHAQPPQLTATEAIVAGLVREGLTNREIARRLALSAKTIEYHLSNTYSKLGVHSRVQLVTHLARESDSSGPPAPAGRQGGTGEHQQAGQQ